MRSRSRSSFLQSGRYGHTCAALSRSQRAGMSPVMIKASLPCGSKVSTVVSRVLGKQELKKRAAVVPGMVLLT